MESFPDLLRGLFGIAVFPSGEFLGLRIAGIVE
jgi:hypothetical protein